MSTACWQEFIARKNFYGRIFGEIKDRKIFMKKIIDFIKLHPEMFTIFGLVVVFYFIFFHNIGNYALMDVDETRYVGIARDMFNSKDFLSLYLNGDYFFEKPPLYFWGECISFGLWGVVNEFSARFPVALYGTLTCFLLYFTGKKIVSKSFGIISALILGTSMEFVILSKFAILDIVLAACTTFSTIFGFMTYFCKEENKKYFWWLFYIFSGLAVMAKGIPGFVIPFGTMFFVSIVSGRFKEIFKPKYFVIGSILFLTVVVPWHAIMLKVHDPRFFDEYIMLHHLGRFKGSETLGREQPFIFMFLTFLWGFLPWTFSAIAAAVCKIREKILMFNEQKSLAFKEKFLNLFKKFDFKKLTNEEKLLLFSSIAFTLIMLFFSISSTKLITYILPVYPFSAIILAFVWKNYIEKGAFEKSINLTAKIFGGICIFAGIASLFAKFVLPAQIYKDILIIKWFCIILVLVLGISSFVVLFKKSRIGLFAIYVIFMTVLSAWGYRLFFLMDYAFGQNDLMRMAKIAKEGGYNLATVGFGKRYSVYYYYGGQVNFYVKDIYSIIDDLFEDENMRLIVKNNDLEAIQKVINVTIIEKGRKYSLIKK